MTLFLIGLVLFLGVHAVSIVAPRWRQSQVARLGEKRWKGIYSIVAAIGLVLLVYGYGLGRQQPVVVWTPPTFTRHLALLLMLPVFPLLFAASLPGRISRAAKHPMLLAVKIWATAHLIANGTLVDMILFGTFLAWAVVDRISLKRRPAALAHEPKTRPARASNDLVAIAGGLVLYAAFLLVLHRWLIGVSPIAMPS